VNDTRRFWAAAALLVVAAVGHSLWATSLDSFTIDEPYHIAAGASYLREGDYRINPEHPPLVKLVVALAEPARVLHLDPLRIVDDKAQERVFTQTAVFLQCDSKRVQRRARFALMTFNGSLLLLLAWMLRRVFGTAVALATMLLLALDPTVSAHFPVVMTDLPMALLGTICCCAAILCVRDGGWRNWLLFGGMAGLLLASKHSAPLIALPLLVGCAAALAWRGWRGERVRVQFGGLAVAAALSIVVLWTTYGFHYRESRLKDAQGQPVETFNRPLDAKIGDLRTEKLRTLLTAAARARVLPRAYLWGLADTLRAGVEGRPYWSNVFGHSYQGKAPWWVPFAILAVKLPIGFILLALGGLGLLLAGRLEPRIADPLTTLCAVGVAFMVFLARNGIFYAGLRHFLFVVPLMAVAGAVCVTFLLGRSQWWLRALPMAAVLWIAITVLPQRRIWEYHNVLAGGSQNAWERFDNEGVDLGQRSGELIAFYKAKIAPAQPLIGYSVFEQQLKAEGVTRWDPRPEEVSSGNVTGWVCVGGPKLAERNWDGMPALRNVQPAARFGNLLIYHGTFYLPKFAAGTLTRRAIRMIYVEHGDKKLAEQYLLTAIALNPKSTSVAVELGNLSLQRKDRDKALEWYQLAWNDADSSPDVRGDIARQIDLVKTASLEKLKSMRNPNQE
jgi:4-amino-4-deoxy-L-arabinose transferase-like glycosyltransferase